MYINNAIYFIPSCKKLQNSLTCRSDIGHFNWPIIIKYTKFFYKVELLNYLLEGTLKWLRSRSSKGTSESRYSIYLLYMMIIGKPVWKNSDLNKGTTSRKWLTNRRTFIMSTIVFKAIRVITKYSNLVDTTSLQILYLIVFLFFGMYLLVGRAFTAKSIHCFCREKTANVRVV